MNQQIKMDRFRYDNDLIHKQLILKCNQILLPMKYDNELRKQKIPNDIMMNKKDEGAKYLIQIGQNNQQQEDLSKSNKKNKNQKKKQRKKRNKLNKFKIKQQKIQQLKLILNNIYSNLQTFQSLKITIIDVIRNINQQPLFFEILNHAINQYIDRTAQSIWYHLDQYINYDQNDLLKQCPKLDQWPQFFILLINQLYRQYQYIQKASLEVQKIIQVFVIHYCNKPQNEQRGYNLTKNTFNHLISSNVFFQKFMKSCQNFLAVQNNICFQGNKQAMKKLQQLMDIFDPYEYGQQQQYEQNEQIYQNSQNSTQEQGYQQSYLKQENEWNMKQGRKKRRKNKKKDRNKQQGQQLLLLQQIQCRCTNEQQHLNRMIQKMQRCILNADRINILNISQKSILQMEKRMKIKRGLDNNF